jgi:hypothetical protein
MDPLSHMYAMSLQPPFRDTPEQARRREQLLLYKAELRRRRTERRRRLLHTVFPQPAARAAKEPCLPTEPQTAA